MTATLSKSRRSNADSKSSQVRALLGTGMSVAEIADKVGCTANLVYVVKANMKAASLRRRGPGRQPTAKAPAMLDGLGSILAAVQNAERARSQMRSALERIQAVITSALQQ